MKDPLGDEDARYFAHVFNFIGELRLHTPSLLLRVEMASARRPAALNHLARRLQVKQYWIKSRNTMVMVIRDQADIHRLFHQAWPYLTLDRQLEFNASVDRQQELLNDRAQARIERDAVYAEAAQRRPLDYDERLAKAEASYDNSDPAVQVIEFLSPSDAIAADLASMAAYRDARAEEKKRLMTQGQITSLSKNEPKRAKRQYARKK